MRNVFMLLAAVLFVAVPNIARSMTVSDPTSYTYYVEQIKKSQEQVEQMMQQITELENVVEQTTAVNDKLKGVYDFALDSMDELEKVKSRMGDSPMAMAEYLGKYLPDDASIEDYMGTDNQFNTKKLMDEIFVDPRNGETNPYDSAPAKRAIRQIALEQAIDEGQDVLGRMPKKFEIIEGFNEALKNAEENENIKASQDLTAAILIEILTCLREMHVLMAKVSTASNLLNYDGQDANISKEAIDNAKSGKLGGEDYTSTTTDRLKDSLKLNSDHLQRIREL